MPDWAEHQSFEEWLVWWIETCNPSQSMMLTGEDGELLMDEVYRFEDLANDVARLRERLGLYDDEGVPRLESSHREADYKAYYNEGTIALVQKHFEADLKLFDYPETP